MSEQSINQLAERIAEYLRKEGIDPESEEAAPLVAILLRTGVPDGKDTKPSPNTIES